MTLSVQLLLYNDIITFPTIISPASLTLTHQGQYKFPIQLCSQSDIIEIPYSVCDHRATLACLNTVSVRKERKKSGHTIRLTLILLFCLLKSY